MRSLYGTITTQLGNVHDTQLQLGPNTTMTVASYIHDTYSYDYSFRGWLVFILMAFTIFFRMVACAGLGLINFQKR